jgi:mono/diheme cytochrome c family protein
VKTEGLTQIRNVYQPDKSEFIRSTDPLFRPVEIKTAPDGSMYVVDMYHGIIQESQWTPKGSYLRAKIEQYQLDKIVGLGRIWRLTNDAAPRDTKRPRMLDERPAQLVRHLRHPNGWWRDMAQQQLVLRRDRSVVPMLRAMARRGGDTMLVARFHALWTLEGLGSLDAKLAREAMSDPNPRMRVQAIRASEPLYKNGDTTLAADYRRLACDTDPEVAVQAMLTMNTLRVPDITKAVRAAVATRPGRGVQVIGTQILNAPADGMRGPGARSYTPAQREMMTRAAAVFTESCAQCHGETGLGTVTGDGQRVAPALAGNPRVTGHGDYVIRTLLHGLTGPIDGTRYSGQIMVSQAQQSDEWIAAMASYIRNTFTNTASFIMPEQVAAIRNTYRDRKTPWTYAELAASVPQLMYAQSGWRASASQNSERAVRAFGTAGWSSGTPQQPGMWYQFELPEPVTLAELNFFSGGPPPRPTPPGAAASLPPEGTFPRGYRVQVSMDGITWSAPVAEGRGAGPSMAIAFKPVLARFVRITQTAEAENAPVWTIQRLQLYEIRSPGR